MLWGSLASTEKRNRMHAHDMHELVVAMESGGYHQIEDDERPLEAGQVVLLPGGVCHGIGGTPSDQARILFICFDVRHFIDSQQPQMRDLFQQLAADRCYFSQHNEALYSENLQLAERLATELTKVQPFAQMMAASLLNQLLINHYRSLTVSYTTTLSTDEKRLKAICDEITAAPQTDYKLDVLAQRAGMCRTLFCQRFRRHTGMTLVAYVSTCRIHRAMNLLAETSSPIGEIALDCGFHNLGHFYSTFRRHCSMTPRAYRRRVQRDAAYVPSLKMLSD